MYSECTHDKFFTSLSSNSKQFDCHKIPQSILVIFQWREWQMELEWLHLVGRLHYHITSRSCGGPHNQTRLIKTANSQAAGLWTSWVLEGESVAECYRKWVKWACWLAWERACVVEREKTAGRPITMQISNSFSSLLMVHSVCVCVCVIWSPSKKYFWQKDFVLPDNV